MRRLLPLLLLTGCAHLHEGVAPVGPQARERALADAQRRAVESVSGVRLESSSKVKGSVSLEQEVTTRSRGSLKSWKIVSESEKDGLMRVRIKAEVSREPLKESVALKVADPRLAAGVARGLAESGVEVREDSSMKVEGSGRARRLASSLIPGTTAARAGVTLRYGETALSEEASAIDADPELAEEKAVEAAGYRAGLAIGAALARK